MDYKTFLGGRKSTATLAKQWDRLYNAGKRFGPNKPPETLQPDPNRPKFTPGALDYEGVLRQADMDYNLALGERGLHQQFMDRGADIDAARPQVDKARDEGYLSADRNTAGRGLGRSGIRQQYRTQVAEQADKAHRDLTQAAIRNLNAYQQAVDELRAQHRTQTTQNLIDAAARQQAQFDPGPAVTPPPAKKPPIMTYKEFLKGRKSTEALAREWDRLYNYGQRFK